MKTIYKYPVGEIVEVPAGAEFLCTKMQRGQLYVWAMFDMETTLKRKVHFRVFGTGHPIPPDIGPYIGTVLDGTFVWHVIADFRWGVS